MRTTAFLSTIVLSAGLLAGCGSGGSDSSGSSSDYCKGLKAAKADFTSFDSSTPDFDKLGDAIDTFHELAGDAPSEVADDWKTLDGALTTMEQGLEDLGLKLEDLGAIVKGEVPEGMTADELAAIVPKLQEKFSALGGDKLTKATDAIEKHAKSECNVDLNED
jgi:hypothetical protein